MMRTKLSLGLAVTALQAVSSGSSSFRTGLNVAVPVSRPAVGSATWHDDAVGATFPISKSSLNIKCVVGVYQFNLGEECGTFQMGGKAVRRGTATNNPFVNWPQETWIRAALIYSDGSTTVNLPVVWSTANYTSVDPGSTYGCDEIPYKDHTGANVRLPKGTLISVKWALYYDIDGSANGQHVSYESNIKYDYDGTGGFCKYNPTFANLDAWLGSTSILAAAIDGTNYDGGGWRPDWAKGDYTAALCSVGVIGDSGTVFANDDSFQNIAALGYIARAFKDLRVPYVNYSRHGQKATEIAALSSSDWLFTGAFAECNRIIVDLGVNDTGSTLAQYKTAMYTIVANLNAGYPNAKIDVCVPMLYTTSSNSYADVAGQTVVGNGLAFRQWLRSESGATPIADFASNSAVVDRIIDTIGTPVDLGIGKTFNISLEYMPGGLSSGKWTIDETSFFDFTNSGANATQYIGSDDLGLDRAKSGAILGTHIQWLTGANAGTIKQMSTANYGAGARQKMATACANNCVAGDTAKFFYQHLGNNNHRGATGHKISALALKSYAWTGF